MATDKAQKLVENVLSLLDLTSDQYTVSVDNEESINIHIQLPEDQTGIYIGHHGEGLTALQLLLSLMVSQRTGIWYRISVNINDFSALSMPVIK